MRLHSKFQKNSLSRVRGSFSANKIQALPFNVVPNTIGNKNDVPTGEALLKLSQEQLQNVNVFAGFFITVETTELGTS